MLKLFVLGILKSIFLPLNYIASSFHICPYILQCPECETKSYTLIRFPFWICEEHGVSLSLPLLLSSRLPNKTFRLFEKFNRLTNTFRASFFSFFVRYVPEDFSLNFHDWFFFFCLSNLFNKSVTLNAQKYIPSLLRKTIFKLKCS